MQKIEQLTPDQIAAMPRYVEKWLAHGLCALPADRPSGEKAIRMMYVDSGLAEPQIIWAESPLSGALIAHVLKSGRLASVGDSVRDSVGDSVWASVRGQHDSHWLAFYDYFRGECGLIDETEKLRGLWLLAQSCGWVYPYENVCIATERPTICAVDDRGLIHNETGPAILYPDGFAIHGWHGVRLPAEWIERRHTIDPSIILRANNVEQRTAGAAMIGWARMSSALDRKVIDGDPNSDIGALVELTLPGLPEPGRFLMAQCPRNGTICEGVPRMSDIDQQPIETAIAAQAWRDCLPQAEYVHPAIRT